MTHQYEEQAAISSDINIYLIRTSRWKNLGSKSHILCLMMNLGMIMIERSRIFHAFFRQSNWHNLLDLTTKRFMLYSDSFRLNIQSEVSIHLNSINIPLNRGLNFPLRTCEKYHSIILPLPSHTSKVTCRQPDCQVNHLINLSSFETCTIYSSI